MSFTHIFEGRVSIKDMIESLGVPHTEVDLILINSRAPGGGLSGGQTNQAGPDHDTGGSRSVDFTYLVAEGDRISVYPVFESLDISPLLRLRPEPLRQPRFVLDVHLGRLAAYLRLLGFDTLYRNDYDDEELARITVEEGRILLTRDRGLLKRKQVTRGYCVRSTVSRRQIEEVVQRFDLAPALRPFTRCVHCNGLLVDVPKAEVLDQLLPHTRAQYEEFRRCERCSQVYWQGSHHRWLLPFIASLSAP